MIKIKKLIYDQKELLITTTIIIVGFFVFFKYIIDKPFILSNDQWFQYNEFYKEWINLITSFIKGEGLPFYSWNMYLGTDFFSSMAYYCVGDIFLPILLFFRNNIENGLIFETILCVYISSLSMSLFLDEYGIKDKIIKICISIIYSFGAESMIYFGVYMFHRFYVFLPLMFLGVLNYFNHRKTKLFVFSTAVLFMQNYYLMYPTLLFLLGFCLVEEINRNRPINIIIKDFFILLFSLLAGFMISAIVVLPGIISILGNPRLGSISYNDYKWDRNVYYGLLMSLSSLNPVDIEGNIFYTTHEVHDNYYNLLIGIVPVVTFANYIFNKKHKTELIFSIVLITIILIRPLNSIMHGFSEPSLRWLFLFNYFLLIVVAKGFEEINTKRVIIIGLVYFLIYIYFIIDGIDRNWINLELNHMHIQIILISLMANLLVFIIFLMNKKLSIVLNVAFIVVSLGYYQYLQSMHSYNAEMPILKSDVEYYNSIDENILYRYHLNYKDNNPNSFLNKNKSLSYGFMTTTTYSSTFDTNINLFNKISGSIVGLEWMLDVSDPYWNTALGNKYYIVYKESELPKELEFEYAYNFNHLQVYKNLMYKGFGYTAEHLDYVNNYNDSKNILNTVYIDNENIEIDLNDESNLEYVPLDIIDYSSDSMKAEITLNHSNILFIPIPNNDGWRIYVNEEKINPISVNGGFIGLSLKEGTSIIEMKFVPRGIIVGLLLSIIGTIYLLFLLIKDLNIVKLRISGDERK